MALGEIELRKFFGRSEHLGSNAADKDAVNIEIKVRVVDAEYICVVVEQWREDVVGNPPIGINEVQIPLHCLDFMTEALSIVSVLNKTGKTAEFFKTINND